MGTEIDADGTRVDAGCEPGAAASPRPRGRPQTHGLRALRVLVRKPLDGRTALAQAVQRFRANLIRDLGGDPSQAQLALIETCSRTWILLESVDSWLQQQPSLINKRKKALLPVLRERQQLADSLLRHLTALGLERNASRAERVRAFLTGPASEPLSLAPLDVGSPVSRQDRF